MLSMFLRFRSWIKHHFISCFLLHTSKSSRRSSWVLRLPKVSLTLQNTEEGFPAEGRFRARSQDVKGEVLPGQQGVRVPGHHRHLGHRGQRLQGEHLRELHLFLDPVQDSASSREGWLGSPIFWCYVTCIVATAQWPQTSQIRSKIQILRLKGIFLDRNF